MRRAPVDCTYIVAGICVRSAGVTRALARIKGPARGDDPRKELMTGVRWTLQRKTKTADRTRNAANIGTVGSRKRTRFYGPIP